MANWSISTASAAAQVQAQLFAREVWREARVNSFWNAFIGEGPNNVIQLRKDFAKEKGDVLNYPLVADLTGKGLAGSGLQTLGVYATSASTRRLEQNEEAPSTYVDTVTLDQLRHAVISGGRLSEQRLAFEMRPEMKNLLAYWWNRQFDELLFRKLSGVTYTDDQSRTLGEAATASTNVLYGGGVSAKNQLTSAGIFTPDLVRKAKVAAMVGNFGGLGTPANMWRMRPMIIDGKPYYGCVLHPFQVYDMQGTEAWEQAHREIGGLREHSDNPIFTGALGTWNGVIFYSHDLARTGSDAGATADVSYADALFFGLQAGILAEAQEAPDWIEKKFDYDDQYGVATGMMIGFDKTTFNSVDFSVIKIQTAAQNPT
jgi:N4-gp56 family major capsid protein